MKLVAGILFTLVLLRLLQEKIRNKRCAKGVHYKSHEFEGACICVNCGERID